MKWKFWEKEEMGWCKDPFVATLVEKYIEEEFDFLADNILYNFDIISMDVYYSLLDKSKINLFKRNFASAIVKTADDITSETIILKSDIFFKEVMDWLDVKS